MPPNSNKIMCYNIDGRLTNLLRFERIITIHNPIICLLQDVPILSESLIVNTINTIAKDYAVLFNEDALKEYKRLDNLILIDRERVKIRAVYMNMARSKATALGALISCLDVDRSVNEVTEHSRLLVFGIYIRPRATYSETRVCLEWINSVSRETDGNSRTIIMGDMNATNMLWCPVNQVFDERENSSKHYRQVKIMRGRQISKYMEKMNLTCLNQPEGEPTFNIGQRSAYIDLAFVGSKALRTWNYLTLESPSEESSHKTLILHTKSNRPQMFKRRSYKRIRTNLIAEVHFEGLHITCDDLCRNWKQLSRERIIKRIEIISKRLHDALKSVQEKITVTMTRRRLIRDMNRMNPAMLNSRVRKNINRLHKYEARRARIGKRLRDAMNRNASLWRPGNILNMNMGGGYARVRRSSGTLSADERLMLNLRSRIRKLRRDILDNMRANRLSAMNQHINEAELWDRFHMFERDQQQSSTVSEESDLVSQEDIDRLAEQKFPYRIRSCSNLIESVNENRRGATITRITEREIMTAVDDLRHKRYMSSIGIRMDVFYGSIRFVMNIIKALVEMSFWACHVPENARITLGRLIPKRAQGQFRIVHISSPLAALLELIALKRLEYRLEVSQLNSAYQFGFVTLVSRHDLVSRIVELFYKELIHKGNQASGLIISLDIEGAFDNVNQDILINKMHREMGNDTIKYWLYEFILNRRIRIKKGSLESKSRDICTGVPQGSALGPILWNYIIHDIDDDITIPGELELLRYADDIILVYSGSDKQCAQVGLDKLVDKLKALDLNIRPEKCSLMGIKLGDRDQRRNVYHINGQPIKRVKHMNILGVLITQKLRLLRKSGEHRDKLLSNIKKLSTVNRLGLINSAKEWRILIESLIKSLLIHNNWPMLLIDKRACRWTDGLMIKAIRTVFDWPSNVSIKLIRLITRNLECYETVKTIAKYRQTTMYSRIYSFLSELDTFEVTRAARLTGIDGLEERRLQFPKINLETEIVARRRHHDPSKWPNIEQAASFNESLTRTKHTWIILDRGLASMMAEINDEDHVTQLRLGKHVNYSISYFNSFALLLRTVSDGTVINRCLTMSETNSMLLAIENSHNSDWRVIQLREKMYDSGWQIMKISLAEERRIRTKLVSVYKGIDPRYDSNAIISDFRLWLMANEGLLNEPTSPVEARTRIQHRVESLSEPNLTDYRQRNQLNKWIPREISAYFQSSHTSITRILCDNFEVWQNITPNWLDGSKMLVLSGLMNNESGTLEHANEIHQEECRHCAGNQDEDDTIIDWHGLSEEVVNRSRILHKIFVCKRYVGERRELLRRISHIVSSDEHENGYLSAMERILMNRIACQRFLSFMVKCCMNP